MENNATLQQIQEQEYYPQRTIIPSMVPTAPDDNFFKYRIESQEIIEELSHQLKGEIYDEKSNSYVQKFEPWVNAEGINKIIHIVYSCGINKNIYLGNLSHEEIYFKCNMIKKKVARLLFNKYREYGIDKDMRNLLIVTIVNTIHSGLSRCEEGKEANQLSTASNRQEIVHLDPAKKQTGFNPLSWMPGGR